MIQKKLQVLDTNELSPRKIFFDKARVPLFRSLELWFACICSYGTFFSKFSCLIENEKFSEQQNFQVQVKVVLAGNFTGQIGYLDSVGGFWCTAILGFRV